ncbi:MAG: outer membrane lipoprotein carrier protein LolA [Alphaproteobacteria bacterium]|nr:outer membrane lipoprotein carrier protein LolA [Alphaproteobacteria bacterium]
MNGRGGQDGDRGWTRRCIVAALLLLGSLAAGAPMMAANLANLPVEDRNDLGRIAELLNGIRSLQAEFAQYSDNGEQANGLFYLERPGRLRFEYAPPSPILLVGTGRTLVFYDAQVDQVSYLPIGESPLAFLLADRFSFERDDVRIERIERRPGVLAVTVASETSPNDGAVTMVFSDQPLQFRQWHVRDARGITTTVALSNVRTNLPLDRKLFQFVDPNPFRNQAAPSLP